MGLPLFESCCFCVPLRTGTLVLGYLNLIGSLGGIIMSALMIIGGVAISSGAVDLSNENLHLTQDQRNSISNEEAMKVAAAVAIAIGTILLILFIVNFIFVIFLLIGGHQGKPGHIKAYLIYSVVMLVIAVILTVVSLITAPAIGVITHFIYYALEVYFLLVIRSHMIKLDENPGVDRAGKVYNS